MSDLTDVLSIIGQITGAGDLTVDAMDTEGQIELVFADDMHVTLCQIDDVTIELHTSLTRFGQNVDRENMVDLLIGNYYGDASGAGRFCLDPRDMSVGYGQRVRFPGLNRAGCESILREFLRVAARAMPSPGATPPEVRSTSEPDEILFRL